MRARLVVMAAVVVAGCAAEKGSEPSASAPASSATPAAEVAPAPMSAPRASGGAGPKGSTADDADPCAGGKIIQDSAGMTMSGHTDPDAIHDAMHKQAAAMAACRDAAIARGLSHDERVEVRFTIATTGDVGDVHATGDDGQLAECIAQVFRTLRFAPTGATSTVVYPLIIKPS